MQKAPTLRHSAWITALAVLLVSCGGADDGATTADTDSATLELDRSAVAEQRTLDGLQPGAAAENVHFIVTLNAAVVAEHAQARSRALATDAPRTLAERSVQSLATRLMGTATRARPHRVFAHALPGFAATVPTQDVAGFLAQLQHDPAVVRIEHDRLVSAHATPLPVRIRQIDVGPWGLDRIDQLKLPLNNTFRNSLDGNGVHVYIVDTGISPHEDFGTRLVDAGYSAFQDGGRAQDCNGHGTHVAGTVAGTLSGVAPGATLVPVQVLNCNGSGSLSSVIAGLDWIMAHGKRPAVVNMSLGSAASTTVDEAVARLTNAGFTTVVSAGNSNTDACSASPARAPSALTIASSTSTDTRSSFSNFGRCVDLFAPGSLIQSAAHTDARGWAVKSGTSMAAPHAAGAAALLLQQRPKLTAAQVGSQLLYQASTAVVTDPRGAPNKLLFAGTGRQLNFPTPWDVHIAQLTPLGKTVTRSTWSGGVTITVHNEDGSPQKGVRVTGQFSNRSNLVACTTSIAGTCVLRSVNLPLSTAALTFAVTQLSGPAMTYKPGDNARSSTAIARP